MTSRNSFHCFVVTSEEVADADRAELFIFRLALEFLAPEDVAERSLEPPIADTRADTCRRDEELLVHTRAVLPSVTVEGDVSQDEISECATINGEPPIRRLALH